MKKMAASPMIAMTLTASAISSTASTIESTITRAELSTVRHDAAGAVNEALALADSLFPGKICGPASGRWKNPD